MLFDRRLSIVQRYLLRHIGIDRSRFGATIDHTGSDAALVLPASEHNVLRHGGRMSAGAVNELATAQEFERGLHGAL